MRERGGGGAVLSARLFPWCALRASGLSQSWKRSAAAAPSLRSFGRIPLAGLPQTHSIIINPACQAFSQFGSSLLSIWKG